MTDGPTALAFFDPVHGLSGVWRAGMCLLFDADASAALPEAPEVTPSGDGYRAVLAERFDVRFSPVGEGLTLGGERVAIARVEGSIDSRTVDCLGTITRVDAPPAWAELDAVRAVSALFDEQNAVLAIARRPRGALGHGRELVSAALMLDGQVTGVEEARISTVYDGEGRQRSAGLELWLPGDSFPRRAAGTVTAGTTLALEGLRVNAAVFRWRMDGREGAGAYELTVRDEPIAA